MTLCRLSTHPNYTMGEYGYQTRGFVSAPSPFKTAKIETLATKAQGKQKKTLFQSLRAYWVMENIDYLTRAV